MGSAVNGVAVRPLLTVISPALTPSEQALEDGAAAWGQVGDALASAAAVVDFAGSGVEEREATLEILRVAQGVVGSSSVPAEETAHVGQGGAAAYFGKVGDVVGRRSGDDTAGAPVMLAAPPKGPSVIKQVERLLGKRSPSANAALQDLRVAYRYVVLKLGTDVEIDVARTMTLRGLLHQDADPNGHEVIFSRDFGTDERASHPLQSAALTAALQTDAEAVERLKSLLVKNFTVGALRQFIRWKPWGAVAIYPQLSTGLISSADFAAEVVEKIIQHRIHENPEFWRDLMEERPRRVVEIRELKYRFNKF